MGVGVGRGGYSFLNSFFMGQELGQIWLSRHGGEHDRLCSCAPDKSKTFIAFSASI